MAGAVYGRVAGDVLGLLVLVLLLLLAALEHLLEEAELLGADGADEGEEEQWQRCKEPHCDCGAGQETVFVRILKCNRPGT